MAYTDFVDGRGRLLHENWDIVNFGNLILVKLMRFTDVNIMIKYLLFAILSIAIITFIAIAIISIRDLCTDDCLFDDNWWKELDD